MDITSQITRPTPDMTHRIDRQIHAEGTGLCYGCRKCSGGCPLGPDADVPVHQIIRHLQLGQYQPVLQSRMIWLCTGCKTCLERCPNEIDSGHIMDLAKVLALRSGLKPAEHRVLAFNRSFLDMVRLFGRAYELGLTMLYKARSRAFLDDIALGVRMMARGKLAFFPSPIKSRKEVAELFMMARRRAQ